MVVGGDGTREPRGQELRTERDRLFRPDAGYYQSAGYCLACHTKCT